jgi:hypothetical protein
MSGVKTGEFGFCEICGNPVAVETTAGDRLEARLLNAYAIQQARAKGQPSPAPDAILRHCLTEIAVNGAVAQALANYGANRRSTSFELKRRMREVMRALTIAEGMLAQLEDGPVDLLREATEELEKETDLEVAHAKDAD